MMSSIETLGFETPTLIQQRSIPLILEGMDVIGESATGSGKTLAFGSGVVERTIPGDGLQALILTPTRELAEQVKEAITSMARNRRTRVISIYGGVAIGPQIEQLRKADIVIATPGRFKDHMQRGTVRTDKVRIVVLDEADRMLDMGFIDDIDEIIGACANREQTLFFSATIPPQIKELADRYLNNPTKITGKKQVDPNKLRQIYYDVPRNMKISLLVHLLKGSRGSRSIVFCNTRKSTDIVVRNLSSNGVKAVALHGGFTQNKRTRAIEDFKRGKTDVLVCTDVAARGIDIEDVSHVYNYEIPSDATDYVHRIGRTARAGDEGQVVNLLSDYDHENFSRVLENHRGFNIEKRKMPYVERVKVTINRENSKPRNERSHFRGRRRTRRY